MKWVEIELLLDPEGPHLAVEKEVTFIIPRPPIEDEEESEIKVGVHSTFATFKRRY